MNPPSNAAALNQPFTGWDELRTGSATWKIEKQERSDDNFIPFFAGQTGKVYEQMLHNLPVMLHCMDGAGRLVSVNRQWAMSLGYLQSEVAGRSFNELLLPASRNYLVQAVYPHYMKSGICRNEPVTVLRSDGSMASLLLSMNAYRGNKGRIESSVCMLIDTAQRADAPRQSPNAESHFRAAFIGAGHGMAIVSVKGRIEFANRIFSDLLGLADGNGLALEDLLHADDRNLFLEAVGQLVSGETANIKQELRFLDRTGLGVDGLASLSPIRNERGDFDLLLLEIVDVSERKEAAIHLQRAQKMEAIGQLTGGLAHDFNNLLTVIIGNLELLESRFDGDDRGSRRLGEAIDAARKGSGLTRQMLAFARKQVLEPRKVQINEMVDGIAPLIARSIGETIRLNTLTMEGEPKAVIDPSQLESSILNLAINARDAMPDGGALTIETEPAYLDEAYAARHPEVVPGYYVMVAVSDTGTGMQPDLLEKVFQPFFTTKSQGKGSGLGLSMVYGFIKQSGGHINIYSEPGHGTSVKMYLPRIFADGEIRPQVEGVHAAVVGEELPLPARMPKILVVEDQEAVRAVACGFLADFGYELIEAEDGLQALAKLQEHADIDLMFSDVVMPGGMNGFDLAQAAKGLRPSLKIVHTSGYPKGAMVHQEEPRFRDGYIIMKPYRRDDLKKIIEEALQAPS